jgi:hypothetical protein
MERLHIQILLRGPYLIVVDQRQSLFPGLPRP